MSAIGVIFSNLHEKHLGEMTAFRTMASVPFGGRYRLVDFPLSNMSNSGIYEVGIITKSNYQSLMQHVGSGKSWDLSRKNGGLRMLPPTGDKVYNTRFEGLKNISYFLRNTDAVDVVMCDSDSVCNIDFARVLAFHEAKHADVTVIYRKKDLGESYAKKKEVFFVDDTGRVYEVGKTDKLTGVQNVNTFMYVINREFLLELIDNSEEMNIHSFSQDVLTKGAKKYKIYGYEYEGYYASIDSVPDYYKHSLELLNRDNCARLFEADGASIFTKVRDSAPCMFSEDAEISDSIVADGCVIEGKVTNSILFRGVNVKKGAVIENSILFQNTEVGENSHLNCVITDKNARILSDRYLSGHETQPYLIGKNRTI